EVERRAFVIGRDRRFRTTYSAVVSVTRRQLLEESARDDVQPGATEEEEVEMAAAVKGDSRFRDALKRRDLDPDLAKVLHWPTGHHDALDDPRAHRLSRPLLYAAFTPEDSVWARPIEGLRVAVDLDTMEVLEVE